MQLLIWLLVQLLKMTAGAAADMTAGAAAEMAARPAAGRATFAVGFVRGPSFADEIDGGPGAAGEVDGAADTADEVTVEMTTEGFDEVVSDADLTIDVDLIDDVDGF